MRGLKTKNVKMDNRPLEADLLAACVRGDERARDELCRALMIDVKRMAARITNEADAAEDLVQESFCRLFRNLADFRGNASLRTWFYRVLVNLEKDRRRRYARVRELPLASLPFVELEILVAPDPSEEIVTSWWRGPFVRAARRLSRVDRKVLWLRFRRAYSHAQIARRMGCTVEAVRCRLYRMMRYLRREMRGSEG